MLSHFHPPYSIFISYPDEDEPFMKTTNAFLTLMDVVCHVAKHQRDAGEELWDKISTMVNYSTRVLLLYTRFAPSSDWIRREITISEHLERNSSPLKKKASNFPAPSKEKI